MGYTIDTLELGTVAGFDLRAEIVPDDYYGGEPDGDYTAEQIDAFANGDWSYVTLIVTASRAGIDLGSDTLAAVENGVYPIDGKSVVIDPLRDENGSLAAYRDEMVDNAIADARLKLTELVDAAIDESID